MRELPPKARLLYVCVVAAGVVAGVHCFRAVWARGDFGWLLLVLFSLCSSLFPVRFPGPSGSFTRVGEPGSHAVNVWSIGEYFIIFGWLAFSPEVAFWIGFVNAAQISLRSLHRRHLYRLWYNIPNKALPALAAGWLFYRIHGHPAPFRFEDAGSLPAALLNLYLGALVFFWLNTILVASAISLTSKRPLLPDLAQRARWMFGAIASATAAGVSFYAFPDSPILVGLAGVPAFLLIQSFLRMDQRRLKLLADSRRFLQGSLDALSSAIAVLDGSGRIVATNEAWRANRQRDRPFGEWLRVGDDYLAACRAVSGARNDSAEAIANGIDDILTGQRKSFSLEYGSPPPADCWHEVRGSRFNSPGQPRVVIAHRDITHRVRSANRLRESEAKYRRFFENDLTGDFVADGSGQLVDCNPAFAKMFGYATPEEALRAKLSSLFTNRAGVQTLLEILREQAKVEYFRSDIRRLDGGTVSVVSNFTAQPDASGQLVGIRGYLFDDTRRKKLEEDLIQAQKMEAVGRLAGGLAHEFNNILTVIAGYAEFLVTALSPHAKLRLEAELILKAAKKGAGLTEQLLAFTPRRPPAPDPVDLDGFVRENAATLRRLLGERIRLDLSLRAESASVRVDPGQLEQVLLNLTLNARDAMPEGGRLRLETRPAAPESVLLRVADSGAGIPDADKERIFEPFFTTKAEGRGTGLGLATVDGIIRQSGGSIEVASRPGRGTRFEIRLPAATKPPVLPPAPPNRAGSAGGSETVLVVEDQRAIRDLICETLHRLGYQVLRASDGVEAAAFLESYAGPVDLLLTDLVMPRMGGWELVQRLRKSDRAPTKILCVSGYPETRGDPSQSGAPPVQYLPKPFTPSQLASKIRQTLDA